VVERFDFGRQAKDGGLCLADFTAPRDSGRTDYVCLFATMVGPGVRALAEEWKGRREYLRSHILRVLGADAVAFAAAPVVVLLRSPALRRWSCGASSGSRPPSRQAWARW
jgi:5-methyltetrahydrofolate--homocysteine methyltransferase